MGRPKGSPNKVTKMAREKAQEMGIDPLEVLLYFAANDYKALGYPAEEYVVSEGKNTQIKRFIEPQVRAACARDAVKYIYPTLQSVSMESGEGSGFKVVIEDFTKEQK